jgi:hypothetical protein
MTASSFVTLAPEEQRVREYHVVEETGRLSVADIIGLVVSLALVVPAGYLVRSSIPLLFGLGLVLFAPIISFAIQLIVRPRVSEILTVTTERVIHYRREHGRFHDGHAYQNVRVRDVSGVTCAHEHRFGGEQVTIFVHTARADAMLVGAGRASIFKRLLQRQNMGPDAVKALTELPSLLPAVRAGDPV